MEDDALLTRFDTNPVAEGHCLIISRKYVGYWQEIDDDIMTRIFEIAKTVVKRLIKEFKSDFTYGFARGGRVKHTCAWLSCYPMKVTG